MTAPAPLVAILVGSKSDWETMQATDQTLRDFGVPHESRVLSAHRTPKETAEYGSNGPCSFVSGRAKDEEPFGTYFVVPPGMRYG